MSELTDYELATRVKAESCSESTLELADRHRGLIIHMAKRYAKANACSGCALQDFIEDAPLVIYKAAESFEQEKQIQFSTWVGNVARFHYLKENRRDNKYHLNTTAADKEDYFDENESRLRTLMTNHEYIMDILSQLKDTRVREIIQRRYFSENREGRKFKVIAKKLGINVGLVQNLHRDFLDFMKSKLVNEDSMDLV